MSIKNKCSIIILDAKKFNGEYNRRNIFYIVFLWLVSILAMITNLIKLFYKKILKTKNKSIKEIMWEMGRDKKHFSSIFVDRFNKFNHRSKYNAANWKSLYLFYNYYEKIKPQLKNGLEKLLTNFWIEKMENRQAINNRLKIVINLLVQIFTKFKNESEIRLLSIASGSAMAVIEAIKKYSGVNIKIKLLDVDVTAINEAKRIVKAEGMEDQFSFIHASSSELEEVCKNFKPHIIEMVGFLDYRPNQKAILLIKRIKKQLTENGVFITCNIQKNREKIFLDWVLLWPMIYRSKQELIYLLEKGGFNCQNIKIISDFFHIHNIAICKK
ncbi:class I SAM-dependent methyltransferase family protein [Candidatus Parcubacteria bacterium]|nr:class I SAM-dependent methyltransferase family protein [Candidatus Parcubacteria bacterium]